MSRLDQLLPDFPEAARRLSEMSEAERRETVADIVGLALSAAAVDHPAVRSAEEFFRRQDRVPPAVLAELDGIVSAFDDHYFELDEAGDDKALEFFSKARATSALRFALSCDTTDGAAEAVYEATHAVDDPTELLHSLELSRTK